MPVDVDACLWTVERLPVSPRVSENRNSICASAQTDDLEPTFVLCAVDQAGEFAFELRGQRDAAPPTTAGHPIGQDYIDC